MSLIQFESTKKLDEDREYRREARELALTKAKRDHDRRKVREEQRKTEQWILPSVAERIQDDGSSGNSSSKSRSKKSKKKEKKKKRLHQTRDDDSSNSGDDTDSDQEAKWVEKPAVKEQLITSAPSEAAEKLTRDTWMTFPAAFASTLGKEETRGGQAAIRRKEEKEADKLRRIALEKPGQHERELNPYWKDGGVGLPTTSTAPTMTSTESGTVGDGGLRVLLRAHRRAQEQAKEEGRSLEEVVSERWGSLENLETMIAEKRKLAGQTVVESRERGRYDGNRHCPWEYRASGTRNDDSVSEPLSRSRRSPTKRETAAPMKCSFMRPKADDEEDERPAATAPVSRSNIAQGWRRPRNTPTTKDSEETVVTAPASITASTIATINTSSSVAPTTGSEDFHRDDKCSVKVTVIEPAATIAPLTDKEMNVLGSKIVKAELMGNESLAVKLRAQLEAARTVRSSVPAAPDKSRADDDSHVVVLTRTDARGMTRPVAPAEYAAGSSGGRRKKIKAETHDAGGQRQRYFADDDRYSLKQMFEREKLGTAEDQNQMFVRLAGKGLDPTNEDYDMDDALVGRANRRTDDSRTEARERLQAIGEFDRSTAAMESCRFCFDGKDTPKHLIVAIGIKVYLCLPSVQSLTDGHCLIVPMQHVTGSTYVDEDVWAEIQIFRKGLTKMFEAQERDVVFFESTMHLKRFPHLVLQCVPLPKEEGSLAPMYFKKAILESETEWAMNKKLVDLSEKDVRRSIPKGLPYFSVDFGLQGGFAHVIEDEQAFPKNFAQEILGGMLDLDANAWRRPSKESFEVQRRKTLSFSEWWKPYDWTSRLQKD